MEVMHDKKKDPANGKAKRLADELYWKQSSSKKSELDGKRQKGKEPKDTASFRGVEAHRMLLKGMALPGFQM